MFLKTFRRLFLCETPTYRKLVYTYANRIEKLVGNLYDWGVIFCVFQNV